MTSKSIGNVAADAIVLLSAAIGKAARRVFWSHDKDLDEVPLERYTTGRLLNALGL